MREELGIRQTVLDRKDLASLEPALPSDYECATLYPDAVHLSDPLELMPVDQCVRRQGRPHRTGGSYEPHIHMIAGRDETPELLAALSAAGSGVRIERWIVPTVRRRLTLNSPQTG